MIIGPTEFAERNIHMRDGLFNRMDFPAIVGPLEWQHQHKGQTVIVLGAAQGFKTIMQSIQAIYRMHTAHGDCGWYLDVEDTMKDVVDQKFAPFFDTQERLKAVASVNFKNQKRVAQGIFKFYSANRKGDRQMKSLRYVACDEAHLYRPAQLGEIANRVTGYQGLFNICITSTGGEKSTEFTEMCDQATEYHWMPPCEHCGKPMTYEVFPKKPVPFEAGIPGEVYEIEGKQFVKPFGGLRFPTDDEVWSDAGILRESYILENLYYECPHCGHRHVWDQSARNERNRKCLIDWNRNKPGWYGYQLAKEGVSDTILFHYSGLYHMDWFDLAKRWLHAVRARNRGDWSMVADYYKTRVGKNFSRHFDVKQKGNRGNISSEYKMVDPSQPLDLKSWWPDAEMMIGTVDVGKDHYWVVFRAWAVVKGKLFSRLAWCGMVLSKNALREYQINIGVHDYGGPENIWRDAAGTISIRGNGCGMFIDGNYDRVGRIRNLAGEYSWVVYRGRDKNNKAFDKDYRHKDRTYRLYSDFELIDQFDGQDMQGPPVVQMQFASQRCLDILFDMRDISEPETIWTLPSDIPNEYLRHLDSWQRNPKPDADEFEWEQTGRDDHLLDCEKMQIGVLATLGLVGDAPSVNS